MTGNLFSGVPAASEAEERLETLLTHPGLRIDRIISTGQASPPGFWYQQVDAEWVLLLSGEAMLRFEDEAEARHLHLGDWLYIRPGRRHRVDWTAADALTIWLAVHFTE